MTTKRRAEIAGAGLAGLAAAAALAQRGWQVRVHEKASDLREIGAGLYLYENALNALRVPGVYEEIAASGVEMTAPRSLRDHANNPIKIGRDKDRLPEHDIQGRMQQPFNLDAWTESHPWYRHYLERLPRHPEEYWRPFYNVSCTTWSRGHVAIVGDAAHGMAPNLGQGACVALCNAVVLARVVTESADIPSALRRWEASERPYIEVTQRNSYLYGMFGTRWPRRLLGLRSRLIPVVAKSDRFQKSMRSAIEHVPSV